MCLYVTSGKKEVKWKKDPPTDISYSLLWDLSRNISGYKKAARERTLAVVAKFPALWRNSLL